MAFFSSISQPLCDQALSLALTVSDNVVAAAVPIAIAAHAGMFFFYGLSLLKGEMAEPFLPFLSRLIKSGIVLGVVSGYNALGVDIVHLTWGLQDDMVNMLSGASNMFSLADSSAAPMIGLIGGVITYISSSQIDNFGGSIVLTALLAFFLLFGGATVALFVFYGLVAKLSLGIALALGPLFLLAIIFDSTRKFFDLWLSTVLNYVLLAGVGSMMMVFVNKGQSLAFEAGGINIIFDMISLGIFNIVALLLLLEIPRLTSALTGGGDTTGAISSYANRFFYGQSLFRKLPSVPKSAGIAGSPPSQAQGGSGVPMAAYNRNQ